MAWKSALILAAFLIVATGNAVAQRHTFGLGIMFGEPTGISAKFWTTRTNAFDLGFAWSSSGDWKKRHYDSHLHIDYLWHSFDAISSPERFPLYAGIGGRLNGGQNGGNSVAVRGAFGIAWMPRQTPVDVFLELTPEFQLSSPTGLLLNAALGARYFF